MLFLSVSSILFKIGDPLRYLFPYVLWTAAWPTPAHTLICSVADFRSRYITRGWTVFTTFCTIPCRVTSVPRVKANQCNLRLIYHLLNFLNLLAASPNTPLPSQRKVMYLHWHDSKLHAQAGTTHSKNMIPIIIFLQNPHSHFWRRDKTPPNTHQETQTMHVNFNTRTTKLLFSTNTMFYGSNQIEVDHLQRVPKKSSTC
jgi:hypothetical protein